MNYKILSKKESTKIIEDLKEQFGIKDLKLDYGFVQKEDKIFLISKDLAKIDYKELRINNIGLYFCTIANNGIRLSIEGSQIIGKKATKNVIEIFDEELQYWFNGEALVRKNISGFVLIKHNNDFLGCGYGKEGLIINYIPKERRVSELIPLN